MKRTVLTSITAIICVVLVSLSLKDGITKVADAKIEAASVAAEAASEAAEQNAGGDELVLGGGLSMGDSSSDSGSGSVDAGTPGTPDGSAGTADGATPDAGAENGAAAENKGPSTVDEVLAVYNNAINKVIADKAGYSKKRTTELNNLEGGALLNISIVVEMVNDFLGVGTTDYKNEKGKAEYLSKASLTKNDLSSIDIKTNDGVYTITLGLKDGKSAADASGSTDTSPLSRSGLFAGKGDKKAYDYKNSENIHTAINGVAKADSAEEKVTNTKIVATIEAETGKMTSLNVSWDWKVELTNVSYSFAKVKTAKGDAKTVVEVKDFKW
ncbi:MAG: hypothetical protein UH249_09480 [Acutalibacteraceae bacterium]|nr:hypothetical protein [Acutalibacteraceae bacterium]